MSKQYDYEVLPGQGAGFPVIEVIEPDDLHWKDFGNCVGLDPEMFFPKRGEMSVIDKAVEVCNECEVKVECLEFAIEDREIIGIWGGSSERERRRIRRERRLGRIANKNNR